MKYKKIIQLAWDITNKEKPKFFPYAFIPSFLGTIVGVVYIAYQIVSFQDSPLLHTEESGSHLLAILSTIWKFMAAHPSWGVIIVLCTFTIVLLYFLAPVFCGGSLIHLISRKIEKKSLEGGVQRGLETFFPLFEFATVTSPFSYVAFITEVLLVMRNFEVSSWVFMLPSLTFVFTFGIFLSLLFVFAEQIIVLEELNMIQAMRKSSLLVLAHVKDVFFLGITLLLIGVRIVLNVLLVLIIPMIVMAIVTFMASIAMKWLGILLSVIIGVGLLLTGAYLMAGFHIFSYAVWTISYYCFRKQVEENRG